MVSRSRYYSAKQIRLLERYSIVKFGIPSLLLMEQAGAASAKVILKYIKRKNDKRSVCVICGTGNNGGDGFVVARYLASSGLCVSIAVVGRQKSLLNDAWTNLEIVRKLKLPIVFMFESAKQLPVLENFLKKSGVIVDAIFGIGLSREVSGPQRSIIDYVNRLKKPVFSLDVPSGLNADSGEPLGVAVKASYTLTMAAPKIGFLSKTARNYLGRVRVMDIGIPSEAFRLL